MEESQKNVGRFLDPGAIISQLGLEEKSHVADFGCGSGYFSIPFAKAVGQEGKLYALDILPQALETVCAKAKNLGLANLVTKRVNLEKENGSKLEEGCVDWVILKDILFQNRDKNIIIKEASRILKTGGKVLLVEWNLKSQMVGPAKDIRIAQADCEKMFSGNGYVVEKNIDAGDFHYAFVAKKC